MHEMKSAKISMSLRWGEGGRRGETEARSAPGGSWGRVRGQVWGRVWGRAVLQVVGQLQVLVEQVAEVGDGEGVHPVVVRGVPVALLHHQAEPGGGTGVMGWGHGGGWGRGWGWGWGWDWGWG